MAWTKREQPEVTINADMVFVGYGWLRPSTTGMITRAWM